jgi:hypothetical protein
LFYTNVFIYIYILYGLINNNRLILNRMKSFLTSILLSVSLVLNGQFVAPKFGKVDPEDLKMTRYDRDTLAGALILFDAGECKYVLNPEGDFAFYFTRHLQVKIFKKSAFDIADINIRLYKSSRLQEKLGELKAVTYNLDEAGIAKTKLENNDIHKTETDNYTLVNFAFPDVKEGSVIELTYTISSSFLYNFRGWTFQYDYPARWSQFQYQIPEYYQYRQTSKGYLSFYINKKESGPVQYTYSDRGSYRSAKTSDDVIRASALNGTLATKDVPAFKSEPNIDCEDNYKQSVEFELASVQFPGQKPHDYTQSWESVNKEMIDDEDFGLLLKSGGFVKDTVDAICIDKKADLEKASALYSYVQRRMKWNGSYRIFSTKGLKKPFSERVGSSSDINLLLTVMLQSAGFDAWPVLFSTRENGMALSYFPTITKFNSVLASVKIENKTYLLDATAKVCPFGILPAEDINGKGRVVNNVNGDWVDLNPTDKYTVYSYYSLNISDDGTFKGSITGTHGGYSGIYLRKRMAAEKNNDDFYRKLQENTKGLTIEKFRVANADDITKPMIDTISVEITDNSEVAGDMIMFRPLLFETFDKNPYTLEERKYPVNYNYPHSEQYVFVYTLPEGYTVESLPKPGILKMPDNSLSFSYNIQASGKQILMRYRYEVAKMMFLPEEYANVKNFYDQLVKKHSEQVIIKKSQ